MIRSALRRCSAILELVNQIVKRDHTSEYLRLTEQKPNLNLQTFDYFDVNWWQVANVPRAHLNLLILLAMGFVLWGVDSFTDRN